MNFQFKTDLDNSCVYVVLQAAFIQQFPVQQNISLWSILPLHAFSDDLCAAIARDVIEVTVRNVQDHCGGAANRTADELLNSVST